MTNNNNKILSIEEIIKLIPHRYPFLLVDKVTIIEKNKTAIGIKNITFNEPQFNGHFPGKPIMPGIFIIESMAQTATVMVNAVSEFNPEDKLVYFMSIDNAKFRKPVIPGDVLELHIEVIQNRGTVWKMAGIAKVSGQKVAEADFSAMIVDKREEKK